MSQIRDTLSETIYLVKPRIILGEYIPCDRNMLESIAQKVMASRDFDGEFVTMLMDEYPERTLFSSEPEMNAIKVREYVQSEFILCDASIQDPTDVGVAQEELVGIYLNHEGNVFYGTEIVDAEGTQAQTISLDKLARIIIDLSNDTSIILDTLLSHHQRRLLDCVYKGTSRSRYKFIGILAESIEPSFENAEDYMDDEEHQNEIEQLLDNLEIAYRNPEDGTILLIGETGIIVASQNWKEYETAVSFYSLIRSSEIFVDALFQRMSLLWDELACVRKLLDRTSEGDYGVITEAQNILTEASANYTIIKSIGGYLSRGFKLINKRWKDVSSCVDEELCNLIGLDKQFRIFVERIDDIHIGIEGLRSEVEGLQTLLSTQIEQQMRRVYSALRDNTRSTSDVIRASERTGNVLDVIELILSGTIAFDIVVTLTGEYVTDFALFPTDNPVLFFALAIALWLGIVFVLKRGIDWLESKVEKDHLMRVSINAKCDIPALESYLDSIETVSIDEELSDDRESVRVLYHLPVIHGNDEVKVSLAYDRKNSFLRDVTIETRSINIGQYRKEVIAQMMSFCDKEE
ncbi:MAG: hypothetical protein ACFFF4_01905 [Candidatus Thorarchaeota archaeon]